MIPSISVELTHTLTADTLLAFVFEDEERAALSLLGAESCAALLLDEEYKAQQSRMKILYPTESCCTRLFLVGVGKREDVNAQSLRRALGRALRVARKRNFKSLTISAQCVEANISWESVVEVCAETTYLALHTVDDLRADRITSKLEKVQIYAPEGQGDRALVYGSVVGKHTLQARDLVNMSPSIATPLFMASYIKEKGAGKVDIAIYDEEKLEQMKLHGILSVGKGSANPPRLVTIEHKPDNYTKTICLVGKGVTFDSGGLSLKPSKSMETMKCDKAGACAVLEAVLAAQELALPVRVIGVCAFAENMPGPSAYKLGDVVTTGSGKTVEILNTDAEGRMVLSDALFMAQRFKPDYIIDLATLTGSCVHALGSLLAGVMGTDKELICTLSNAGVETHERLWELPLDAEYERLLKSRFADIKNVVGAGGSGPGAIYAGLFLKHFVGDSKWAHLDIAGPAWLQEDPWGYLSFGGSGFGVRLLVKYLSGL